MRDNYGQWEREAMIRGLMSEDPFKRAMDYAEADENDPFYGELEEAHRRSQRNGRTW